MSLRHFASDDTIRPMRHVASTDTIRRIGHVRFSADCNPPPSRPKRLHSPGPRKIQPSEYEDTVEPVAPAPAPAQPSGCLPPPAPPEPVQLPLTREQKRIAAEKRMQRDWEHLPETHDRRTHILEEYAKTWIERDSDHKDQLRLSWFRMLHREEFNRGPYPQWGNWGRKFADCAAQLEQIFDDDFCWTDEEEGEEDDGESNERSDDE